MTSQSLMRLGIFPDFPEEGWQSMDLCADMLMAELSASANHRIAATRLSPAYRRLTHHRNVDRLLNRMWLLPRFASKRLDQFDAFHIVDHSYSQLLHALPANRTGVFCHDLDTFGCLLDPARNPRPRWFRAMSRQILAGMQKAAIVFYTTEPVREQIVRHGLVSENRLVKCPLGIAPGFDGRLHDVPFASPGLFGADRDDQNDSVPPSQMSDALFSDLYILHVGSCIARKRIDVLLRVFAAVRATHPELKLVKVGGPFDAGQQSLIDELNLRPHINLMPNVPRHRLAELYRQARLVLQPSNAEGFGLPVIEALACGATVIASNIPVLREVGGNAVLFAPVGDVDAWAEQVRRMLDDPLSAPAHEIKLAQAAKYSWQAHARIIASTYLNLIDAS